jgi:chromosome segregation ATPase
MIDDTIGKIQQRLQQSPNLAPEKREELEELLAQLKTEIATLSESDPDRAKSIAGFTEMSAHEDTRATQQQDTMESALDGLESSVAGFEANHPKLVAVVNRIAATLSNLGI